MTRIDHILVAVPDLDLAVARWANAGLNPMRGGQHPGGTSNALIRGPEPAYIELITAGSGADATADRARQSPGPLGWALGVTDIGSVRSALSKSDHAPGLARHGSRTTPDGEVLTWDTADIADAVIHPTIPFLIQWDQGMGPGPAAGPRIREVVIESSEPNELAEILSTCGLRRTAEPNTWTDGKVRVTLSPGDGGIREVTLQTGQPSRDLILDDLRIRCVT